MEKLLMVKITTVFTTMDRNYSYNLKNMPLGTKYSNFDNSNIRESETANLIYFAEENFIVYLLL